MGSPKRAGVLHDRGGSERSRSGPGDVTRNFRLYNTKLFTQWRMVLWAKKYSPPPLPRPTKTTQCEVKINAKVRKKQRSTFTLVIFLFEDN